MNSSNFISIFFNIKGIRFFYLKKIWAFYGINLNLYKIKILYLKENKIFFKKLLFLFTNFNNYKYSILKNKLFFFFKLLKDINHYKGKRLIFSLPLNGQRTHTNAKTIKKLLSKNIKKKKKIIIFYIYYFI